MTTAEMYINERLDHLGIVAGVCQEIGLAAWLDAQDPSNRQQVSVGTATVAMILNGLGFSNRQLYLVPQYFANKPVEHLLGVGISAKMLNDDCLGRTLDWLYAHDPTKLFAGIASRARQVFGISARQVHVDTTSFSVSGAYNNSTGERVGAAGESEEAMEAESTLIAITYGYSRDHREDLKQWMLALATTHDGDVPLFLQPLDGNSSDKVSLPATVTALQAHLREAEGEPSVYVSDNEIYSTPNMQQLNAAGVKWVSRVSETSTEAKTVLQAGSQEWQTTEDGSIEWYSRIMSLPQGSERWAIVRTPASQQRAQMTLQRHASRAQASWERKCWHLGNQHFACEADARAALERELKASSVFVKKPERIIALSLIMVLCLLVYRLAEYRLRTRLTETVQAIPDQVHKPTTRPTMRWVFQCFEGIELLHVQSSSTSTTIVLRLESVHRLILALLGPLYENIYKLSG